MTRIVKRIPPVAGFKTGQHPKLEVLRAGCRQGSVVNAILTLAKPAAAALPRLN
jgi:hypothetical protein